MCRRTVLTALLATAHLSGNAPAFGQTAERRVQPGTIDVAAHVTEAAQRFGLPEPWIYAVLRTESAGQIKAVSPAGAMGLMQLMPGTWARQRARFRLGKDPFNPRDNILAGTSYLREMYDSYGVPGFLAAYNAGPGRYEEWRDRGRRLPAETRHYVAKIAPLLQPASAHGVNAKAVSVQEDRIAWMHSPLFVTQKNAPAVTPEAQAGKAQAGQSAGSSGSPGELFATVPAYPEQ